MTARSTTDGGVPASNGADSDVHEAPDFALCESLLDLKSILLESVADGVIAHTPDGVIVFANARAAEINGMTLDEMLSAGPYGWTNPGSEVQRAARAYEIRAQGGTEFVSARLLPDGSTRHIEVHSRAVHVEPWGELFLSVSHDISARVSAQEELKRLAYHDGLTGLCNRLLLHDRIEQAVAASADHDDLVGVVYLDLDDFKPVNDTHGHDVGDRVLRIVGERLDHSVRDGDTIARVGGDEFIALFPRVTDGFDLNAKARELAEAVSQPISIDGATLQVTVTAGLATYEDPESIGELIRRADSAMYQAKHEGRTGWESL